MAGDLGWCELIMACGTWLEPCVTHGQPTHVSTHANCNRPKPTETNQNQPEPTGKEREEEEREEEERRKKQPAGLAAPAPEGLPLKAPPGGAVAT